MMKLIVSKHNFCNACSKQINLRKQLAIAIDALKTANTTETKLALKSIAVLNALDEPETCKGKK